MTSPRDRRYLAAADLLRVLCIVLVAWFHIWQQSWLDPGFSLAGTHVDLQRVVRRGYMMVDVILALSGFLLYLPRARAALRGDPAPGVWDFYGRRLRRILPSYLFAVGAAALLTLRFGRAAGSPPLWADLLAHLTFTHTFFRSPYLWTSLNGALWTLAVEMQFYLLFPLFARWFDRRPFLTWGGMTAAALLFRLLALQAGDLSMLVNQLPSMLDLYAFGMLAAYGAARAPKPGRGRQWLCALGSLAALALIVQILALQTPVDDRSIKRLQLLWRLPLAACSALFLWCGAQWPSGLNRAVGNPVVRFCSVISYNFYIWHQYLAVKLKELHLPPYFTALPQRDDGLAWQRRYTLYCWLAALAAAVLATYLVEKPCARLFAPREKEKSRPGAAHS